MKITKSQLKRIIKEEIDEMLGGEEVKVGLGDTERAAHEEETSRYVGSSSGENRKKAFEIYRKEQLVKDMKNNVSTLMSSLGLPLDHPIIKKIINNLNQLERQLKADIAAFRTGKGQFPDPRKGGAGDWDPVFHDPEIQ